MSNAIENATSLNPNSIGARHTAHVLHAFGDLNALERTRFFTSGHDTGHRFSEPLSLPVSARA